MPIVRRDPRSASSIAILGPNQESSVYSACLYCHTDLGRNDAVEHFTIGRRLAFDAANGRLWVICATCKRWNLSPVEERWDAIDECERLFEKTRLRMSTDNIGLARIAEGTELVRVGSAMRPELAAWRFGAQLAARRKQYRLLIAGAVVGVGAIYAGVAAVGIGAGAFNGVWQLVRHGYERATRLVLPAPASVEPLKPHSQTPVSMVIARRPKDGIPRVETEHAKRGRVALADDGAGLLLRVPIVGRERATYDAVDTPRVLTKILAKVNRSGGRKNDEQLAVGMIERVAGRGVDDLPRAVLEQYASSMLTHQDDALHHTFGKLATPTRLALEMALQEQRERELLAGELLELEVAWKEAEELARIADTLTSSSIDRALANLKRRMDV